MDHNTKKQIGVLELRIQELRRENEEREGANEALRARNEAITTEAKNLVQENKQLKAELEERKRAWEADRTCLQAQFKKLEGFQKVRINEEKTKFFLNRVMEN